MCLTLSKPLNRLNVCKCVMRLSKVFKALSLLVYFFSMMPTSAWDSLNFVLKKSLPFFYSFQTSIAFSVPFNPTMPTSAEDSCVNFVLKNHPLYSHHAGRLSWRLLGVKYIIPAPPPLKNHPNPPPRLAGGGGGRLFCPNAVLQAESATQSGLENNLLQ